MTDLDKDRDAYRRDPAKVGKLDDKYLIPLKPMFSAGGLQAVIDFALRLRTAVRSREFARVELPFQPSSN